jgi:hypothetical protein
MDGDRTLVGGQSHTRTAKSIFIELQQRAPDQYPDVQLRRLQRRIAKWRATIITTFDDQWLQEEVLADAKLPRPLRAVTAADGATDTPTHLAERASPRKQIGKIIDELW